MSPTFNSGAIAPGHISQFLPKLRNYNQSQARLTLQVLSFIRLFHSLKQVGTLPKDKPPPPLPSTAASMSPPPPHTPPPLSVQDQKMFTWMLKWSLSNYAVLSSRLSSNESANIF